MCWRNWGPSKWQHSTSPSSIIEKPARSKWSIYHPCSGLWWTAWSRGTWCGIVRKVSCLLPPGAYSWRSLFARHQFFPKRPGCFSLMLNSVTTITFKLHSVHQVAEPFLHIWCGNECGFENQQLVRWLVKHNFWFLYYGFVSYSLIGIFLLRIIGL